MDEIDLILQLKARKDDHLAHAAAAAMERASIESRDALEESQAEIKRLKALVYDNSDKKLLAEFREMWGKLGSRDRRIEQLEAALKNVQKDAGDCYQGASDRKPILVISQIWQTVNEALETVPDTDS